MKITEDCINHNAFRLIDEITFYMYEAPEQDEKIVFAQLAEIRGICEMANVMKEVLKE